MYRMLFSESIELAKERKKIKRDEKNRKTKLKNILNNTPSVEDKSLGNEESLTKRINILNRDIRLGKKITVELGLLVEAFKRNNTLGYPVFNNQGEIVLYKSQEDFNNRKQPLMPTIINQKAINLTDNDGVGLKAKRVIDEGGKETVEIQLPNGIDVSILETWIQGNPSNREQDRKKDSSLNEDMRKTKNRNEQLERENRGLKENIQKKIDGVSGKGGPLGEVDYEYNSMLGDFREDDNISESTSSENINKTSLNSTKEDVTNEI